MGFLGRRRAVSMSALPGSTVSLTSRASSTNLTTTSQADGQLAIIRMLNKLQYRKERYDRGTMWGIFGFGIISLIAGLSGMIVELISE